MEAPSWQAPDILFEGKYMFGLGASKAEQASL